MRLPVISDLLEALAIRQAMAPPVDSAMQCRCNPELSLTIFPGHLVRVHDGIPRRMCCNHPNEILAVYGGLIDTLVYPPTNL